MSLVKGADTGALRAVALDMEGRGADLATIGQQLEAALTESPWRGPDSDRFRSEWSSALRPQLQSVATALTSVGQDLSRQANEQDQASGVTQEGSGIISDIINGVQDIFMGDGPSASDLGGSYADSHPDWDPASVDLSEATVGNIDLVAQGAKDANTGEPNWMAVYEQAAVNHFGGEYKSIIADTPDAGLSLITGQPVDQSNLLSGQPSPQQISDALAEGRPITAMSDPLMPFRDDIAAAHVYMVVGADPQAGTITVMNPWGLDHHGSDGNIGDVVEIPIEEWGFNFVMTGMGNTP